MKALSIKQPWAWLICKGFKGVENRTWKLPKNFEVPQRIYVHTGLSKSEMTKATYASILYKLAGQQAMELMIAYERLPFGAIIGEVDIVGCKFRFGEELDRLYSVWHAPGMYGFLLRNPVLYKYPRSCKGKLGFFEPFGGMDIVDRE